MKKLLLLLTVCICFGSSAFAQDYFIPEDSQEDETVAINLETGEEKEIDLDFDDANPEEEQEEDPEEEQEEDPEEEQEEDPEEEPEDPMAHTALFNSQENNPRLQYFASSQNVWQEMETNSVVLFKWNRNEWCAGAVIGKYTVLTAADCITRSYFVKTGKRRRELKLTEITKELVAYPGGTKGKGIKVSKWAFVPKQYMELTRNNNYMNSDKRNEAYLKYNYAILVLKQSPGVPSFTVGEPNLYVGTDIAAIGFSATSDYGNKHPWLKSGEITYIYPYSKYLEHDIKNLLPGAPVFEEGNYKDVVAIHHYGGATRPSGLRATVNKYKNATPK